jgi:hypothetical protein
MTPEKVEPQDFNTTPFAVCKNLQLSDVWSLNARPARSLTRSIFSGWAIDLSEVLG